MPALHVSTVKQIRISTQMSTQAASMQCPQCDRTAVPLRNCKRVTDSAAASQCAPFSCATSPEDSLCNVEHSVLGEVAMRATSRIVGTAASAAQEAGPRRGIMPPTGDFALVICAAAKPRLC